MPTRSPPRPRVCPRPKDSGSGNGQRAEEQPVKDTKKGKKIAYYVIPACLLVEETPQQRADKVGAEPVHANKGGGEQDRDGPRRYIANPAKHGRLSEFDPAVLTFATSMSSELPSRMRGHTADFHRREMSISSRSRRTSSTDFGGARDGRNRRSRGAWRSLSIGRSQDYVALQRQFAMVALRSFPIDDSLQRRLEVGNIARAGSEIVRSEARYRTDVDSRLTGERP
jgi:hypothetical protein